MAAEPSSYRFDLYPRDWLTGTRQLTPEERGIYMDLLALIYERRGRFKLPSEEDLRRMLAVDVRVMRRIIGRLVMLEKIEIRKGIMSNPRADRQLGIKERVGDTSPELLPEVHETSRESSPEVGAKSEEKQEVKNASSLSLPLSPSNHDREGGGRDGVKPLVPERPLPPPLDGPKRLQEDTPGRRLVHAFLALRERYWPNDSRLSAPMLTLLSQAESWLNVGLDAGWILGKAEQAMEAKFTKGEGPPNGFGFIRLTLENGAGQVSRGGDAAPGRPPPAPPNPETEAAWAKFTEANQAWVKGGMRGPAPLRANYGLPEPTTGGPK